MKTWEVYRRKIRESKLWYQIPQYKLLTGIEFAEMFKDELTEQDYEDFKKNVSYVYRQLDAVGVWVGDEHCHLVAEDE